MISAATLGLDYDSDVEQTFPMPIPTATAMRTTSCYPGVVIHEHPHHADRVSSTGRETGASTSRSRCAPRVRHASEIAPVASHRPRSRLPVPEGGRSSSRIDRDRPFAHSGRPRGRRPRRRLRHRGLPASRALHWRLMARAPRPLNLPSFEDPAAWWFFPHHDASASPRMRRLGRPRSPDSRSWGPGTRPIPAAQEARSKKSTSARPRNSRDGPECGSRPSDVIRERSMLDLVPASPSRGGR